MTRQPLRRQIRTLVVCASFAALVATVSLGLIRLNGGQLTNQAGRRIESLSLLVLLAGLSGAASLAAAVSTAVPVTTSHTDLAII